MVTFIQATYVLAKFLHTSIISAVTDHICSKILTQFFWGPYFLWNIIFFRQNFF